jgi:hypothetical protein
VKAFEMLELLREFYRDKSAMRHQHVAAAQHVKDYNFNNTYQYVIAREDMHVTWVIDAITDLGGEPEEGRPQFAAPSGKSGKGKDAERTVIAADRDAAARFIEKWRGRLDALPNARHRIMLHVILGEVAEHKRFFDLALAGRTDLLGRRADGAGTGGGVLATRWLGGEKT